MQLTSIFLTALAGTALAAPSAELETRATNNMMAAGKTWTITNFKRVCGPANKQCTFTYGINDGSSTTQCNYKSTGNPASHASYSNVKCGPYTVGKWHCMMSGIRDSLTWITGSTWSNQFGNDQAFTTLSVVKGKQIIYLYVSPRTSSLIERLILLPQCLHRQAARRQQGRQAGSELHPRQPAVDAAVLA